MTTNQTCMMATLAMLFASALTGCSKNEPSVVTPADPLAICLNAGMQITSKAAVNNGDTFIAAIAGWESSAAVSYGAKHTWQTSAAIMASEAASDITLTDAQHYSHTDGVNTYIKAWYPAGTLADDGVVTFGGAADGTIDVLLAGEVSGSSQDADGKTLVFNHPLTQIKFAVQGDASFGSTTLVKSISIKDAELPTGVDLKIDAVNYTTTELAILEIDGTQSITTSETIIGKPAMIRPITGSTFKIDIETSETTYRDVVITVTDDNLKAGKAYTITLNFKRTGITSSATITDWVNTGLGAADIL